MHTFDLYKTRASERFKAASVALDCFAAEVDRIALLLDDSAETCSCCSSTRYRNFPQKILRDRVCGAATRLREIAETFRRRAHEPDFVGTLKPDQDMLVHALVAIDESADAAAETGPNDTMISGEALALVRQIVRGKSGGPP